MADPLVPGTDGPLPPRRRSPTLVLAALTSLVVGGCGGTTSTSSAEVVGALIDPERRGPQGRVPQFVVECAPGHTAYDDPIVLPDRPGESHLHQFFGNVAVTADPSAERVLGADTTCDRRSDTAAYWVPALLDSRGHVVEPLGATAYYRPGAGVDHRAVRPYPPGLMLVAGGGPAGSPQHDVAAWSCGTGARRSSRPLACPEGSTLRLLVTFPDCWTGDRLRAFGSSAHAMSSVDGSCPASHPVVLPQLQLAVDYPPLDPQALSFSSGSIDTAHADFWNVWDQDALEQEVAWCLNRGLVCDVAG